MSIPRGIVSQWQMLLATVYKWLFSFAVVSPRLDFKTNTLRKKRFRGWSHIELRPQVSFFSGRWSRVGMKWSGVKIPRTWTWIQVQLDSKFLENRIKLCWRAQSYLCKLPTWSRLGMRTLAPRAAGNSARYLLIISSWNVTWGQRSE